MSGRWKRPVNSFARWEFHRAKACRLLAGSPAEYVDRTAGIASRSPTSNRPYSSGEPAYRSVINRAVRLNRHRPKGKGEGYDIGQGLIIKQTKWVC